MSVPRILAAIVGVVLALTALGLIFAGGGLITVSTLRDQDGVLWSKSIPLATSRYAFVAGELRVPSYPGDWMPRDFADIRIDLAPTGGRPLFVGIGPSGDVDRYLNGVG